MGRLAGQVKGVQNKCLFMYCTYMYNTYLYIVIKTSIRRISIDKKKSRQDRKKGI